MTTRNARAATRKRQRKINNILLIAGALIVLVALGFLFTRNATNQSVSQAQIGKPLGEFSLKDLQGNTVRLSDYQGKTVLLNAWATWCPPCKAEMPDLNAYYETHRDQGFVILAINAGDPATAAQDFASQQRLSFPILLDPDTDLLGSLGVRSFPTSILLDSDGVVKKIHLGMYSPQELENDITPYLAGAQD